MYNLARFRNILGSNRLVADLSPQWTGFVSGPTRVGLLVKNVTLGQTFLRLHRHFSCQYHSTIAPYYFFCLSQTLYNLRNWQYRYCNTPRRIYCLQQHCCENLKLHNHNSTGKVPETKISIYTEDSYKVLCPYKPLDMDCLKINTGSEGTVTTPHCGLIINILYVFGFVILYTWFIQSYLCSST